MQKPPMDADLCAAAEEVMQAIEEKLLRNRDRNAEEVLGAKLAQAYQRWEMLVIVKKTGPLEQPKPKPKPKMHPWRARAVLPKRKF